MTWTRTTEQHYWEMLGQLPPAYQAHNGFLVGEAVDHNDKGIPRFRAFVEVKGTEGTTWWVDSEPKTIEQFKRELHQAARVSCRGTPTGQEEFVNRAY